MAIYNVDKMKKYLYLFALITASLVGSFIFTNSPAKAQEYQPTPCDSAQYSALVQLPKGDYSIYARAGRKEDVGSSNLYYKQFDSDICRLVGSFVSTTKNYQKVGGISLSEISDSINLYYRADSNNDNYAGASSPQVVFAESGKEPCDLTTGCDVTYKDQQFTLSPKKISISMDSLRVGLLLPIEDDIKEVFYTVDGKPSYSKPSLKDFNLNYVPDGEHTISRTVVFKNGQSLSDSKVVKRGLEGGVTYLFISLLYGQSRLLKYIGAIALILIVYSLIGLVIKSIVRRRRWKKEHFFDPNEHFDISKAGAKRWANTDESYGQLFRHHKRFLGSVLVLVFVFYLTSTYGITVFRVDGVSMYPTLKNQSRRLLYTLPVTVGKVNNNYYLPTRGTMVVVEKDDNNLFDTQEITKKQYVVKRVVGLPNERVVIKEGKIIIYNKDKEEGFEPDSVYKWVSDLSGSEYIVLNIKLKEGEVFVIGDNRDESIDSRFYGPILTSQVVGKVL